MGASRAAVGSRFARAARATDCVVDASHATALAEAQALVRRRDHYLGWINEIDDQLGDDLGMRIAHARRLSPRPGAPRRTTATS